MIVAIMTTALTGTVKATDVVVTLDNIGAGLTSTANATATTTNITATGTSDVYALNYYQCKKQGSAMLMTKSVSPYISNHTAMPGNIKSVEVFINSGASGKTTYDCAFSTTECTSATSGIGAVNITGGNSHTFTNSSVQGKYFCITLGNANNGQVLKLVITCEESGGTPSPSISASNIDILYSATGGNISYSVENSVEGGAVSALVTSGNWLTLGNETTSPISFTCSANNTAAERTATVQLTYTYNTNETVTKDVTVTQAGNPNIVDEISDITASNTEYAVKGTIVAMSARGFVVGDGTGYVYYYYGSEFSTTYNIGDDVKLSGTTGSYGNVIQFPAATTVTSATDSNYDDTPAVLVLDATAIAAYSSGLHLSDYVQLEGTLIKSGNYYNLQVANLATDASISYPTTAQTNAMDDLLNKSVIVKGYFAGMSSGHFNVMLESVEEVVSTTPTITVSSASLSGFTYEEGNGSSAAQTFTVSGENLTANISLSLGGSDYEMSLTENGTYTSSLTLNQSSGEVSSTTVYVRLKAGLTANSYNDNITISSTGATNVTVSLSGNVTTPAGPNVTWDLTTNSYSSASTTEVDWTSSYATMILTKENASSNANAYLNSGNPVTTRFYTGQLLTITPKSGYSINSVEITGVSGYVAGFTGNDWTNASTSTSNNIVTVTPTNGSQAMSVTISATTRATAVKVYYAVNSTPILSVDPTTAELFTYEVGDGPSDYQMFEVTGINLTDDITVSVTGEYELSDGNPYTSSLTLSSGDIFMVQLKEGLESGSYDGEITISSPGATSLTIALSGTVTAVIPATIIPDITAVNVGSAEGDGTIDLTYTKVDESSAEVRFFDADGNSVEDSYYSWIDADVDSNNNIYFTVGANNTSAARTAYLKVYGQDDNGGDVFSELITITQSKYQPTGTLSNADIVAAGTKQEGYSDWTVTDGKGKKWFSHAIKNQHSNATSGYHFLQIKKNDNSGPYYIQVPDYGRKITSLKMTVSSTGQPMTGGSNAATIYFSASNTTSETGIGVASGSGASSVTIDCSSLNLNTGYITASGAVRIWDVDVTYEPLKLNSYGYATYASTNALDFTNADGFTAWQITGVSGDAINFSQITGAVEAGTGVLLMGTGGAEVTIINAESGETLTGNKLEGVTESKSINANEYYGLSGQSFVKVNAGTVSAGKALLPASEVSAGVKAFTFVFEDDATGIEETLSNSPLKGENIYNLAGQMVNGKSVNGKLPKGIYIVNGKKVMVK